jgi:hypothetical protein
MEIAAELPWLASSHGIHQNFHLNYQTASTW